MQKKSLMFVFTSVFSVMIMGFASAAFHYGGYSLSDLLNTFDSSTVILTSIFLIAFILIFWPLSKFFRENPLLAGIISFAISFLLIFEINRRGYDFTGFFYSIGISGGILYTIVPLVLIIGLIFSGFKYGWGITLTSIGLFFIIITFTNVIYEKGITFILGAILLGIGIWLLIRRKRSGFMGSYDAYSDPSQRQIYRQQRTQQKYQQNLENREIRGEQRQQQLRQKAQGKLAERERQAHDAEVRRRAKKIAKIRERREAQEAKRIRVQEK